MIGDINLNGVPFEIADVIYFTNYFIDQVNYPLVGEALQLHALGGTGGLAGAAALALFQIDDEKTV